MDKFKILLQLSIFILFVYGFPSIKEIRDDNTPTVAYSKISCFVDAYKWPKLREFLEERHGSNYSWIANRFTSYNSTISKLDAIIVWHNFDFFENHKYQYQNIPHQYVMRAFGIKLDTFQIKHYLLSDGFILPELYGFRIVN